LLRSCLVLESFTQKVRLHAAKQVVSHFLSKASFEVPANSHRGTQVKLYRVSTGALVELNDRAYLYETDWNELINRDDLKLHLSEIISGLPPANRELYREPLAPIESQEVWAAGVTYFRSRTARMAESHDAGADNFL
jgi:hypothetical protein